MITPYLLFNGNCNEAMEFYKKTLHGKNMTSMIYGDYEMADGSKLPDEMRNYIMHGEMEICGVKFWFADEIEKIKLGNSINLVLHYANKQEAVDTYQSLLEDGNSLLKPTPQIYCAVQAAVEDRYGNHWHLIGMK